MTEAAANNQSSQSGGSPLQQQSGNAAASGGQGSAQATGGDQNQNSGQQQQQQVAQRPDYVPESHWDAEKGTTKETFGQFVKDTVAFKAAEESRLLALPKSADEYKLELPKDWKAPAGLEFKLDDKDPLFAQAREFAVRNKLSQDEFSSGIALLASSKVADATTIKAAFDAEVGKLGANGPARVSAVTTWMDAKGYGALKPMLVTADMVTTFEKMMQDVKGGAPFSQQHRDTQQPGNGKIEGYKEMNFAQRRAAQDAARAKAQPAN